MIVTERLSRAWLGLVMMSAFKDSLAGMVPLSPWLAAFTARGAAPKMDRPAIGAIVIPWEGRVVCCVLLLLLLK